MPRSWSEFNRLPIVERASAVYQFHDKTSASVQGNLDAWPAGEITTEVMLRVATQHGCGLRCIFCGAPALKPLRDLSVEEMLDQVRVMLTDPWVVLKNLKAVRVATFGYGEPTLNEHVPAFFMQLTELIPGVELTVSTTAPETDKSKRGFDALLATARELKNVLLQISLHSLHDAARQAFARVALCSIATLAQRGRAWFAATGKKVILNCGVGKDFSTWGEADFGILQRTFPPEQFSVKLSYESALDPETPLVETCHVDEIRARQQALRDRLYDCFVYDPAGRDFGAGCGAHVPS